MIHGFVLGKDILEGLVIAALVGMDGSLLDDVLLEVFADRAAADGRGGELDATGLPAAFHKGDDFHLMVPAASLLGEVAGGLLVAPIGFVHFDGCAGASEGAGAVLHGFTDAVGHEPRGLVGNAQRAV